MGIIKNAKDAKKFKSGPAWRESNPTPPKVKLRDAIKGAVKDKVEGAITRNPTNAGLSGAGAKLRKEQDENKNHPRTKKNAKNAKKGQ